MLMSGTIIATIAQDVNGDGIRNPEDTGLPGWTVFVDFNSDGVRQAIEPQGVTDGNGALERAAAGEVSLAEARTDT